MRNFVSVKGFLLCAIALFIAHYNTSTEAMEIGVNYGMVADNLPTPDNVVALLKSRNIQKIRLFDPNPDALKALEGSEIQVILGTRNEDLPKLGTDPSFATAWINTNVIPHSSTTYFRCISVGNEVIPSDLAANVLPAMQNLNVALKAANLSIPVSTTVAMEVLGNSFPPSQGAFSEATAPIMGPITTFLASNGYPLLANVYPYFAYASDPTNIPLDYATFAVTGNVVKDRELAYQNLFDAMLDSMYTALEKVGGSNVDIIISETGWPSAGNGDIATVPNAQAYNNNLIAHLAATRGSPKRPSKDIETYIFAIFNEDLKPEGVERNFGLYHPDMTEVYHVNFAS